MVIVLLCVFSAGFLLGAVFGEWRSSKELTATLQRMVRDQQRMRW